MMEHIRAWNLNLVKFGRESTNGDCLYTTLFNGVKLENLECPARDQFELRLAIMRSLENHR